MDYQLEILSSLNKSQITRIDKCLDKLSEQFNMDRDIIADELIDVIKSDIHKISNNIKKLKESPPKSKKRKLVQNILKYTVIGATVLMFILYSTQDFLKHFDDDSNTKTAEEAKLIKDYAEECERLYNGDNPSFVGYYAYCNADTFKQIHCLPKDYDIDYPETKFKYGSKDNYKWYYDE